MPAALLLSLLLSSPSGAARWDARLSDFAGDVELKAAGSERWARPAEPMPLEQGDEVRVGKEGFAEISLGASSLVRLEPGSRFLLEDMEEGATSLRLKAGLLLQKLLPMKKAGARLSVATPSAVCAVRGTEFAVKVEDGGTTSAAVFSEGSVEFSSGDLRYALGPEQEVSEARPGGPGPLKELASYRAQMRRMNKRLAAIRRRYRALPLEKKRRLREALR